MQSNISKGKGTCGEVCWKPGPGIQECFPSGVTTVHAGPPATNWDSMHECYLPGKLITCSMPKVSIGVRSCSHPLLSVFQNAKLPEGKQVFSINCIVFIV